MQSNAGEAGDRRRSQRIGNGLELDPRFLKTSVAGDSDTTQILLKKENLRKTKKRVRSTGTISERAGARRRTNDDRKRKYRRRGTNRGERRVRTRHDQTPAIEDVVAAVNNAAEQDD